MRSSVESFIRATKNVDLDRARGVWHPVANDVRNAVNGERRNTLWFQYVSIDKGELKMADFGQHKTKVVFSDRIDELVG